MFSNLPDQKLTFQTIELSELKNTKLLSRFDRKYVVPIAYIDEILSIASSEYSLLSIENKVEQNYISNYFDTSEFSLYQKHHNKRIHRFKVRTREYIDSKMKFAEIKIKSKTGLTEKHRIEIEPTNFGTVEIKNLMSNYIKEQVNVIPQISIYYKRKTLVHKVNEQRITIDTDLTFFDKKTEIKIPHLAIIEIKYSGSIQHSKTPFTHIIKKHESNFSKYCIGMSLLHPNLKKNNFQHILKKTIKSQNVIYQSLTDNH